MQHLDEGTIHSWLDGALSADEAARVEAHVAECPECAAAVAEARGFIAASSRILTALDHVPSGVVPVVPAVRWYNRAAWRAAAAVLVVAVGSLVVVRNSERSAAIAPSMADSVRHAQATVTQRQIVAGSPAAIAPPKLQTPGPTAPSTPSTTSSRTTYANKPAAEADFSAKRRSEGAIAGIVAGVTPMDAVREQQPLNVVGTPRAIGARVTLYEVAPGDTVTLTELTSPRLERGDEGITGAPSAQSLAGRAAEKSAAAPAQRANAAVVSAPDSQSRAGAVGVLAISPTASAPPLQVEITNGVTAISWPDATTHNVLKLSGRMSVERLKEIKLRIERERAAAAAKKSP
jgi:hypothetical protein